MNIIEAAKSGRRFRRPGWSWSGYQTKEQFRFFIVEDVLADDYELEPVAEDCRFPYIPEKSYDGRPLFHCELQKGHSGRHNINEFWWPEIHPKPREPRRWTVREGPGVGLHSYGQHPCYSTGCVAREFMEILTCECGHESVTHYAASGACLADCRCMVLRPRPERP